MTQVSAIVPGVNRLWLFIDEQGDVKFGERNSVHFALGCVATFYPQELSSILDKVRHENWNQEHVSRGSFHAHDDCPAIRAKVFEAFALAPIVRMDVVALTKANIYENLRSPASMYRAALRVMLRHSIPRMPKCDELMVVTAEWPPAKNLPDIVADTLTRGGYNHPILWQKVLCAVQAPCSTHAGLQFADYLTWAAHRVRTRGQREY